MRNNWKHKKKDEKSKQESAQKEREDNCGEHYYISSGGKYSPQGQMICQDCGKIIN